MDDLISRQAAIDAATYGNPQTAWQRIEALPSAQPEPSEVARDIATIIENEKDMRVIASEPQWIPCSEGLPKAQTEVIVSCTDDSGDTKFRYTSSGWVTTNKEYWIVDNEINNFVVAWREMPEPYKGEQWKQ